VLILEAAAIGNPRLHALNVEFKSRTV
jgi:hypothetical protein